MPGKRRKSNKILTPGDFEERLVKLYNSPNAAIFNFEQNNDNPWTREFIRPLKNEIAGEKIFFSIDPLHQEIFQFDPVNSFYIVGRPMVQISEINNVTCKENDATTRKWVSLASELQNVYFPPAQSVSFLFDSVDPVINEIHPDRTNSTNLYQYPSLQVLGQIETTFVADEAVIKRNKLAGILPIYNNEFSETFVSESFSQRHDYRKSLVKNELVDVDETLPHRMYFGKFFQYPFRGITDSFQHMISSGSNIHQKMHVPQPTFPPKTKLNICLKRTKQEKLLYMMFNPNFTDNWGFENKTNFKTDEANTPPGTGNVHYTRFSTPADDDTAQRHWGIYSFKFEIKDIALIILKKRVNMTGNPKTELKITQLFSSYRMQTNPLARQATHTIDVWFDRETTPIKAYILFAREAEVIFLPHKNDTNLCPSFSYRPTNLKKIRVRTSFSDEIYQESYTITNLLNNSPSAEKDNFSNNLVNQLLIPSEKRDTFFERRWAFDNGVGPLGDAGGEEAAGISRGFNSIFPLNLIGSRQTRRRGAQVADHGIDISSVFQVDLEFQGPVAEGWYMIVFFEYLCRCSIDASSQQVIFEYVDIQNKQKNISVV